MKFFNIKIMVPLSYTVTAPSMKDAEAHGRKLTQGKQQPNDLAPFLHSVIEVQGDDAHGQPHKPAA